MRTKQKVKQGEGGAGCLMKLDKENTRKPYSADQTISLVLCFVVSAAFLEMIIDFQRLLTFKDY